MNRTRKSLEMNKTIGIGSWPRFTSEFWRCPLPMNRTPSSRPSPPVGEKVPGGRLRGIPTGSWLRFTSGFLEVFPTHEPFKIILL